MENENDILEKIEADDFDPATTIKVIDSNGNVLYWDRKECNHLVLTIKTSEGEQKIRLSDVNKLDFRGKN